MLTHRTYRWLGVALTGLAFIATPVSSSHEQQPAPPFAAYYGQRAGLRLLGAPRTGLTLANGAYAQYFEKGRLEAHLDGTGAVNGRIDVGRLAADLIAGGSTLPVGGDRSSVTYRDLQADADPARRLAPPQERDGPIDMGAQGAFIPIHPQLERAPGHIVPPVFWGYMQQRESFPGGWLRDLGLPLTAARSIAVEKAGNQRSITMQVFERSILTHDPLNPIDYRVERANVGSDYLNAFPPSREDQAILDAVRTHQGGDAHGIQLRIQYVDEPYARVRLQAGPEAERVDPPGWVFVQKRDGQWAVVANPTGMFSRAFYYANGIPETLWVGGAVEQALLVAAHAFLAPRFPDLAASAEVHRQAGSIALLSVRPGDPAQPALYLYGRLDDIGGWTMLSDPATDYDMAFYQAHHIPDVLWLAP